MFEVGDLVKIVKSPWFLDGEEIHSSSNTVMLGKVGCITEKHIEPESTIYLVFIVEQSGAPSSYYYYEHELERAE